jgi:hypothetical protein
MTNSEAEANRPEDRGLSISNNTYRCAHRENSLSRTFLVLRFLRHLTVVFARADNDGQTC